MPRDWNALAEASDGLYVPDDFKRALNQIVSQQCLYLRHARQAVAYRIIARYSTHYEEALDLLGFKLKVNDKKEYCVAIQHVARHQPMTLQLSLVLMVLRHAYHLSATVGDLNEFGDAVYDIPTFADLFHQLTGRDLNPKSGLSFRDTLRLAQQRGLAKEEKPPEDDPQPFMIVILPGIADVLEEHVIDRFAANLKAALIDVDSTRGGGKSSDESEGDESL